MAYAFCTKKKKPISSWRSILFRQQLKMNSKLLTAQLARRGKVDWADSDRGV